MVRTSMFKFTEYFRHARDRPDRIAIRDEWILRAIRDPLAQTIQQDGRVRRWVYIPKERRYLCARMVRRRMGASCRCFR